MSRYLFWMRLDIDYYELIECELLSVAQLYGVDLKDFNLSYFKDKRCTLYSEQLREHYSSHFNGDSTYFNKTDTINLNIFLYGTVRSEQILKSIFERCILVKSVLNIWNEATDYDQLASKLLEENKDEIEKHLKNKKWSVKFTRHNNKSIGNNLVEILGKLSAVFDDAGEVDLDNPDTRIVIIEKYTINKKTVEKKLERIYFGHLLYERFNNLWWNNFNLSARPILGPTSLETSLSFIMSNLGKVGSDSIVYDPFVGSGGALIASSTFGGWCFGSDIDMRILRGWGISYKNPNTSAEYDSTNVFVNFSHYNLQVPEILRCDIKYSPFKDSSISDGWVDSIITDPPYGNRASFAHNKLMKTINDDLKLNNCFELIEILLSVSYRLLVKGGRLVFLLPANNSNVSQSLKIIDSDRFKMIHIGQQILTGGVSRFIVALEKC
ncbi:tRNA (guanine(10)-N(2))-methyltransferase [Theileria orientalis]|uniref:tRNA (Guanine(10)-N(2))-methyltransferase n=1 Tax=Theileria orientalis TaxID=68886 RepID=A0A976M461_THEOR|nr:tRNA (guanine(10)-N(2))-methyltransferase [Theileria orientalis]